MTIPSAILERVRKLLALAEHPNTPAPEAENASIRAANLIDEYRISPEALGMRSGPDYRGTTLDLSRARPLRATLYLLGAVARHYGCLVLIPATGNSKSPTLVGDVDDIAFTTTLWASLVIQRDREMMRMPVRPGQSPVKVRTSFALGYAAQINARLVALRKAQFDAAYADANTAALAVYDRTAAVERWMADNGAPVAAAGHNRATVDARAMQAGRDAADRADLGGTARIGSDGGHAALSAGR